MNWTHPRTWPAWRVHLTLCVLTALAGLPLWICHGIPFLDFPNHMARVHILSVWNERSGYSDFYRPQWVILPNLGLDLLPIPLAKIIPIIPLSKIFVTGVFMLIVTGFAQLRRQLHGSYDPLAWATPFMLLFNTVTGFGFMNYLMGLGLALWSLALCWQFRDSRWRPLLSLGLCLALFFTHLMGFALFALAWVILELTSTPRAEQASRWKGWIATGATFLIPLIILKMSATTSSASGSYWDTRWDFKLKWLYMALSIGHPVRDSAFEIAMVAAFLILIFARRVSLDLRAWVVGICFFGLFLAAPYQSLTSAFIDARLPIWFLLIFLATFKWSNKVGEKSWNACYVGLMLLASARTVDLCLRYQSDNRERIQVERDLSTVPSGSLLFQAAHVRAMALNPTNWDPPLLHLTCLTAIDRPIYLNNLFTLPQQQPLVDQPWLEPMIRDNYLRYPSQARLPRVFNEAMLFQKNMFAHDNRRRGLFMFYIKPKGEKPVVGNWKVVVDRPRYTLYQVGG